MKLIKHISEQVEEELEGAAEYAKCANKWKDENPTIAKAYYDMSLDEMRHVDVLHNLVVTEIRNYRNTHGDPPASMQAVYDYLHEQHIEKAGKVKALQMQYRGQ